MDLTQEAQVASWTQEAAAEPWLSCRRGLPECRPPGLPVVAAR
jgi:hypothetical protein